MEAERKKQLVFEAFENAKRALERDQNSFAVHKVSFAVQKVSFSTRDAVRRMLSVISVSNYVLHLLTHTVVRHMPERRRRLRGGKGENRKFLHNQGPLRGEFKRSVQTALWASGVLDLRTPCANTSCVLFSPPIRQLLSWTLKTPLPCIF